MTTHSPKRVSHTTTNNIVRLMANLSKLVIIMGRYLGIYAKDSLDELLLTTHHNSSYGGRSREIERNAVNHYINGLKNQRREWVERSEDPKDIDRMNKPNGDNFPYIRGHSNPY